MSGLYTCYPFRPSIKCSCDFSGRPVSCLPVIDFSLGRGVGSSAHAGGDVWDMGRWNEEVFEEEVFKKMETKVILSFTLLVMVLLTFAG